MHPVDNNNRLSARLEQVSCRAVTGIVSVLFGGLLVLSGLSGTAHAEDSPKKPGKNGRLLFQDTFSQKELQKAWRVQPNSFRIEKGVLIAGQRPDAHHGAVCDVLVDFKNLFLEFSFLLEGKSQSVPVSLKRGRWYRMTVRISGKTMQVALDGKPLASLQSEGIAHPTKTDFGFTVIGRFAKFDNYLCSESRNPCSESRTGASKITPGNRAGARIVRNTARERAG